MANDNLADAAAVDKRKKRLDRQKAEIDSVLTNIMQTASGRAWVYGELEACNVFGNAFLQGSSDGTAFNLGMQNYGKRLLSQINDVAPDKYMPMLKEAKIRNEQD